MKNLCCVLNPVTKCSKCTGDICQGCLQAYVPSKMYRILVRANTSKVGKRGIEWIHKGCRDKL